MRALIGETNYLNLKEDLIPYSSSPNWDESTDYNINDVVIYEYIPYKALEAITDDATTPDCSTKWEVAPKFYKTCYNEAWTNGHLRAIICNEIWAKALPFYKDIIDAGGYADEATDKTNDRINSTRSALYDEIRAMKKEFKYWNDNNNCFSISLDCPIQSETQKHHRKVGWAD